MRSLILGVGAQAKYVLEAWSRSGEFEPAGLVALADEELPDWPAQYGAFVAHYRALYDDLGSAAASMHAGYFITCSAEVETKCAISERALASGLSAVQARHPAATVATTAILASNTIVNAGAVVQPFAEIREGAMVHARSVIEHDCVIGPYANVGPGATLAGWVSVERGARVMTGASVAPNVRIGRNARVAAGATVLADVPEDTLVAGVPAQTKGSGSP